VCSLGALQYPLDPDRVSALLEHQAASAKGGKRVAENIAKTFKGLALLHSSAAPNTYAAALHGPAAAQLCAKFVAALGPGGTQDWAVMAQACAQLRLNPAVGEAQGRPQQLFEALQSQLAVLVDACNALDAVEALAALGQYHGLPVRGQLPPTLLRYEGQVARLAAKAAAAPPGEALQRVLSRPGAKEAMSAYAPLFS
jgi:hypothetical protein